MSYNDYWLPFNSHSMNISEYAFADPIAALKAFALENTVYADRVAPRRWCGSITAGALSSWWR